jgi:hypothetical protein
MTRVMACGPQFAYALWRESDPAAPDFRPSAAILPAGGEGDVGAAVVGVES